MLLRHAAAFLALLLLLPAMLSAAGKDSTRVVILGAGNPNPDPENAGPAVAIITG